VNVVEWVEQAGWWQIGLLSIVLNVQTVATSVVFYRLVINRRPTAAPIRPSNRRDWILTGSTTLVNSLVLLPAWWLWKNGTIELATPSAFIVVEVLYLIVGLDAAMYFLHRIFHQGVLYRWFHSWHHTDDRPLCDMSLFVMHPAEAAGFGAAMIVLMVLWPVSVPAVAIFFGMNLVIGTLAHVPPSAPSRWDDFLGWSRLHRIHHDDVEANFGFFTQFWDRALGTYR